jgi:glycosyltransferase involved in cell wall biosynthesis
MHIYMRIGRCVLPSNTCCPCDEPLFHAAIPTAGTDMNENIHEDGGGKPDAIYACLVKAHAIVAFTPYLARACRDFISSRCKGVEAAAMLEKVWEIPQAVPLDTICRGDDPSGTSDSLPLRASLDLPMDSFVMLLPSGIRGVKDPAWLIDAVKTWHTDNPHVYMVIVGPVLDESLFLSLAPSLQVCGSTSKGVKPSSAVLYHAPVIPARLHRWMKECNIVLNTSKSEGQSCAIMEAMALGCVVIARQNEGNASLLHDGRTGRLVNTPDEAIAVAQDVYMNKHTYNGMCAAAASYAQTVFSPDEELHAWDNLLRRTHAST